MKYFLIFCLGLIVISWTNSAEELKKTQVIYSADSDFVSLDRYHKIVLKHPDKDIKLQIIFYNAPVKIEKSGYTSITNKPFEIRLFEKQRIDIVDENLNAREIEEWVDKGEIPEIKYEEKGTPYFFTYQ